MERTQIINELRRFEISDNVYNNISSEIGERYYIDTLEKHNNTFFDDLRYFIANKSKETASLYIAQTLTDLEDAKLQLHNKFTLFLKENESTNITYIRSMNTIQQEYLNKMINRLTEILNTLSGQQIRPNFTQELHQSNIIDTHIELLIDYSDLLTIKDLVNIFKVTRQTVHKWDSEGRIQRINKSGHPRYLKSDIKRLLIEQFPELIQKYKNNGS